MSKYLWINASLSQGGSERVMTTMANAFADQGLDTAMALVREGKAETYATSPRLRVIPFHYGTKNKTRIFLKRLWGIRKLVRAERPEAVISFMWDINAVTLLACAGLGTRVIVSERAHPMMGHQNAFRQFTQKWLYRRAWKVVFQTEEVARYFPRKVREKAVVIPNPIHPALPEIWQGAREKEVVAIGRFVHQKNYPMLLRVFAAFSRKHPDWRMSIYGDGQGRAEMEKIIREEGIGEKVRMPGFIPDVPGTIRKAGMYLNGSHFEGICNAMLEAMAMGIPCVCTDCPVGGAAMAITDRKNGRLIPLGDEEGFLAAMEEIAEKPDFAEKMGREAAKIRERFSIARIAEAWKQACGV